MNNGWHEIEAMLPPIGMLVWVADNNGRVAFAERVYHNNENNNEWVWSLCDSEFHYQEDGFIDKYYLVKNLQPKYWHELPQLPNIDK